MNLLLRLAYMFKKLVWNYSDHLDSEFDHKMYYTRRSE